MEASVVTFSEHKGLENSLGGITTLANIMVAPPFTTPEWNKLQAIERAVHKSKQVVIYLFCSTHCKTGE